MTRGEEDQGRWENKGTEAQEHMIDRGVTGRQARAYGHDSIIDDTPWLTMAFTIYKGNSRQNSNIL